MFGPFYKDNHIYKVDSWGSCYFIFKKDIESNSDMWVAVSRPYIKEGFAITIMGRALCSPLGVEKYLDYKFKSWRFAK